MLLRRPRFGFRRFEQGQVQHASKELVSLMKWHDVV